MEGDHVVIVLVTTELLAELGDWSQPVQVKIERHEGMDPEYTMVARTPIIIGVT